MKVHMKETTMAVIMSAILIFSINPMNIAISLLAYSILSTKPLYQTLNSSWLPFILILTFSSGMMTLFMYASSLSPNEVNKMKKSNKWASLLLLSTSTSMTFQETTQESMKMFSSQSPLVTMTLILILTLSTLTVHSHQPFQTLNSSF